MKFVSYQIDEVRRVGVLTNEGIHPIRPVDDMLDLIGVGLQGALELGADALDVPAVELGSVRLISPLQPPTVRDFVTFEDHVAGVVKSVTGTSTIAPEWYEAPTFYFGNPYSVKGPFDDIEVPPGCEVLDFELEVAAVVGRTCESVTPEGAEGAIFGYTIFNDWSARDLQSREMKVGLGPAKGKDFAITLGPALVTADEFSHYRNEDGLLSLNMEVRRNGEVIGADSLSNMSWTFEEMISYASRGTVVRPGDVLGSGTCGNGGCLAELWGNYGRDHLDSLRPGEVVEMEVQGIGKIRNRIVAGSEAEFLRPARNRMARVR